jgi:hypothetical protein
MDREGIQMRPKVLIDEHQNLDVGPMSLVCLGAEVRVALCREIAGDVTSSVRFLTRVLGIGYLQCWIETGYYQSLPE